MTNYVLKAATGKDERGITLLLSILIMSGIFLISVTVSFFVIQEIRSSRASLLTEPAIVAADAGAEQGIWTVKRGDISTLPTCNPTTPSGTILSQGIVAAKCLRYSSVTLDLPASQPTVFYFYDPEDVNGNLCMYTTYTPGQYAGCGGYQIFQSVTMAFNKSSVNLSVDGETLDGYALPGWDDLILVSNPSIPVTLNVPSSINASSTDGRFTLRITPSEDITVTLDATGRDHALVVRNGLPDYPTVDAMGCASRGSVGTDCTASGGDVYRRRLNVTVPR